MSKLKAIVLLFKVIHSKELIISTEKKENLPKGRPSVQMAYI
jgi:hypothetical protein